MAEHHHIKDHYLEARIFRFRAFLVGLVVLAMLVGLGFRFYSLQVVQHQDFVTESDRNRIMQRPLAPKRGLVYDRNQQLLADNRASYTLSIVRERVDDLEQTIDALAEIIEIRPQERERFHHRFKQRPRPRPYEAVALKYRLTEQEIALIAVNEHLLPGVEVLAQLVRYYPYGDLFAHSLGYVGRINPRERDGFDEALEARYKGTDTIGKIGIERFYEEKLLGDVGFEHVETNARGRVLRVLDSQHPQPGEELSLYLDANLQQVAVDALDGRRGAAVAIEIETGGVVALVSTPSYDPNLFVTGISHKNYDALNQSRDLPLINRALQGQYPPGSTVKPIIGLAGLEKHVVDRHFKINDRGIYQLEGRERKFRDWNWKKGGHGRNIDLRAAIEQSCDVYFYDLAFRMGIDSMHEFGVQFGLGEKTGIDIPSERRGNWPSRAWKKASQGLPWFPGDSVNMGIGQGFVLTTPLQLAQMTAVLASRGERIVPQVVKSVGGVAREPEHLPPVSCEADNWDYALEGMYDVVHGRKGTARAMARGAKYKMAGKSGTAQVVGIAQDEEYDEEKLAERNRDHALFVGFAPYDNPKIAVAVIVENAGGGSTNAAPVVRKIFDAYLKSVGYIDAKGQLLEQGKQP